MAAALRRSLPSLHNPFQDSEKACRSVEKASPVCLAHRRSRIAFKEDQIRTPFVGGKTDVGKVGLRKNPNEFGAFSVASDSSVHAEQTSEVNEVPDRPSAAQLARTLLEVCTQGTLSSVGNDSWPIGTSVKFSVDSEGSPVFLLDSESLHALHIVNDNRCSLHVNLSLPGGRTPQCTLKGKVIPSEEDAINLRTQLAWNKRFGVSENSSLDKPKFYYMQIEQILAWRNFGEKESIVSFDDYFQSKPDALRNVAFKIVEDMNREHYDDIKRFCYIYANIDDDVEDARLIWVDEMGFDVRVITKETKQEKDIRLRFPRLVSDDRDARSSIMMMAQIAWEKERNYIPPEIPLLGHQSA